MVKMRFLTHQFQQLTDLSFHSVAFREPATAPNIRAGVRTGAENSLNFTHY
jgi:hypothetical protein